MEQKVIDSATVLIKRYKGSKRELTRNKIRNELYLLVKPFQIKCIKERMAKRKTWLEEPEILSMSWDAFLFWLQRYKEKYFLPFHIRTYTGFFLGGIRRGEPKEIYLEESKREVGEVVFECSKEIREDYVALKQFHEFIEKELGREYIVIFEDALMSMTPSNFHRINREKEFGINHYRYVEAKKIFRQMIAFLLVSH